MGLFGLSKEIKEQIEEELKVVLCSGFFSELSILVRAQDTIEEICEENEVRMPSERYCLSLLKKIKKKYAVSGNNENFNRLHNVFSQLNHENIIAIHYADCGKDALSVVYEEMQRIEKVSGITEGYCYYGEYELETVIDKQVLSLIYGSHNASETQVREKIGNRVVELLREQGFEAEMTEGIAGEIQIHNFVWDKVYDDKKYAGKCEPQ